MRLVIVSDLESSLSTFVVMEIRLGCIGQFVLILLTLREWPDRVS